MSCTFCRNPGHTIKKCTDPMIAYALMQLRCKRWKSINQADTSILWIWLRKQEVVKLRAMLIHKYNISPKTHSIVKLVAIIMELELEGRNDAFWRFHLPTGFMISATDKNNLAESELLITNIEEYQVITPDIQLMSNEELVNILMPLYNEHRNARRAIRQAQQQLQSRKPIEYTDMAVCEDTVFECSICYEDTSGPKTIKLGCNHEFCCGCIENHIRSKKESAVMCPLCRREILTVSMSADGNESLIELFKV